LHRQETLAAFSTGANLHATNAATMIKMVMLMKKKEEEEKKKMMKLKMMTMIRMQNWNHQALAAQRRREDYQKRRWRGVKETADCAEELRGSRRLHVTRYTSHLTPHTRQLEQQRTCYFRNLVAIHHDVEGGQALWLQAPLKRVTITITMAIAITAVSPPNPGLLRR
jgi:hypothetical protein